MWSRRSDSNRRRDYSRHFTKVVLLPLSHCGIKKNKDKYTDFYLFVEEKIQRFDIFFG